MIVVDQGCFKFQYGQAESADIAGFRAIIGISEVPMMHVSLVFRSSSLSCGNSEMEFHSIRWDFACISELETPVVVDRVAVTPERTMTRIAGTDVIAHGP